MPNDKIDAVDRIERDYGEMRSKAFSENDPANPANAEVARKAQTALDAAMRTDLAAILTPAELEQYELRNSHTANNVMRGLRNIDVTEAEYTQLYRAQKAFDEASLLNRVPSSPMTPELYNHHQTAQLALNEQVRSLLAEDRFYAYVATTDQNYAQTARALAAIPGLTPRQNYQTYQLQSELQDAMMQFQKSAGTRLSAGQRTEFQALLAGYNTRLESTLGAEAAAAYRKTGRGTLFNAGRRTVPPKP